MAEQNELKPAVAPLWTRDFTIITLGSVVSMLGNAMSGFALSLLVLDYTDSPLLYAIYIATFTAPQIVAPIFSGAILDRFSRKRTIYTLDFISAGIYAAAALILSQGWFSFPVLAVWCFIIGTINSVYMVAYESFYPMLITEGNYSKAYSIASVLETLAAVMIPISTYLYNKVGIAPLLGINAVSSSPPPSRRRRSGRRRSTSRRSGPRRRRGSPPPGGCCGTSGRASASCGAKRACWPWRATSRSARWPGARRRSSPCRTSRAPSTTANMCTCWCGA